MALSLAACGTQKRETLELFAMDTYMTFVAIGDGADDVLTDLSRTVNMHQRFPDVKREYAF